MTNLPALDPATQALIQSIPPAWQTHAVTLILAAMILGRLAITVRNGGGLVPMIKSVLFGVDHPAPTTAPKPQ